MIHVELVQDEITMELISKLRDPSVGAISIFLGTARNDSNCLKLEYVGYEKMALKQLHEISNLMMSKYKLDGVLILHRLGEVLVGKPSILVSCSSKHRTNAIRAVEEIMDKIKKEVCIWKKEHWDGGYIWKENAEWKDNFNDTAVLP